MNMLRCVLRAAKYKKQNPYFVYRSFKGGDDMFDAKTLNLADVSSFSPCVINLFFRIVESGSTLSNRLLLVILVFLVVLRLLSKLKTKLLCCKRKQQQKKKQILALLLVHQTHNLSRIKFVHISRQVEALCISWSSLRAYHMNHSMLRQNQPWIRKKKHRHARRARVFFLWSLGDRSIHGAVYSNDWVNLTSFSGCDVQQERNWEFMMYIRCYIGNSKIAK